MARKNINWRAHLTPEEVVALSPSDMLLAAIEQMRLNFERNYAADRQRIVNRAIQRAKTAERQAHAD